MSTPPANVPAVTNAPPPRCYHRREPHSSMPCGELAAVARPGRDWFSWEYFCREHASPGDVEIPAEHVFRRVGLQLEVFIAGAGASDAVARAEAIARLDRAIQTAGGVADIAAVRSVMVKSWVQPVRPEPIGVTGSRE
jgi:hypothetical protein